MKKPYKVSTKDLIPGVAPLHEESNSWTIAATDTIAMFVTEIRPGGRALKDIHADADHVFYYTSGYGYQIINGERFDFGPNDCLFVPKGATHECHVVGNETVRMVVTFSPLPADKKSLVQKLEERLEEIGYGSSGK
ncbi:MAG: cupin domain-containing protein [Oscillospiraceae bacterium]|nr:cupin domain-containing protein [Oscillospiraceae bacterium]MCL2277820.1 cupin domain-containing protein [Oscillospiraceae bacterium]